MPLSVLSIPAGYMASAASGVGYTPSTDYNVNPSPQPGVGAYGSVPGPIGIPANYWQQMQSIYPVTGQATTAANLISNQMAGQLSPEEIATYQTLSGQFGAGITGGPTQFSGRAGLLNVGRRVSDVQQQSILNYEAMLKALSGTLTPQDLAAQIASRNATMAAAPNPQQAAEQQMKDWMEKFQMAMQASTPQTRTFGMGPQSRFPYPGYETPYTRSSPYTYETGGGVPAFVGPSTTLGEPDVSSLVDQASLEQWMGELGYDPYGYQLGTEIPPGSYPESNYYGGTTYTQPEEWWLQGYEDPAAYDIAQYPGWYEDVGYYDTGGYDDMAAYPGWYEDVGYGDLGG